jgi:V8-like Glu-specific endopeptidase
MSSFLPKRSWFSRLNPFVLRTGQTSSRRPDASRSSFRPTLEKLEDRLVLSPTLVTNTTAFPASAVVQIITTFPDGKQMQGTGTMVNQNTVLTAGHMVYDHALGGWARSIEVIPGRNGNKEPYGVAWGTADETFNSFIADDNRNSNGHSPGDGDIGFVSLNRNIGNSTGWLGFMATSGSNYNVNKYGYPGTNGYNGTQMYYDFGRLNAQGNGTVSGFAYWGWSTSSMSAIPGQSGSSLILNLNGKLGIIGVQDVGDSREGYAEVTTQPVLNELAKFEKSHPAIAGVMVQLGTQPASDGVAVSSNLTVNAPGAIVPSSSGSTMASATAPPLSVEPLSPLRAPSASPVMSSQSPAKNSVPQSRSPLQMFLDGVSLTMGFFSAGGSSAALADAALVHDIEAEGGFLNPYLDAGLLTTESILHGS